MNIKRFKLYAALLGLILAFAACQPEEFSMGKILSKEDLKFSIIQNADDPNMVILESQTPGVTPLWVTPTGRSTRMNDTVKIAFAGDYKFVYGVESAGGFVQADTFNLSITTNNFGYINDPLWEMLSGGVGNSKTWYLDLDAEQTVRKFMGPIWFFTSTYTWDNLHSASGGNYIDSKPWIAGDAIVPNLTDGSATWYWEADYAGNSWMCDVADFGTMTFDLIDGANLTVDQEAYGEGYHKGTYLLDVDNHTLKTTDAYPLHPSNRKGELEAATELRVLYLSKDFLQILIVPSGTCLNYISKDYRDNWVPADVPDPEPVLPDGWQDDISKTVNTTITWKFSESNPLDWAHLDGSLMNGWQAPEDYPDWLGTPDPNVYGNFSMTMNSADSSVVFVTPDGTTTEGTYSLNDKGIYSFDVPVPSFTLINWASFAADANNQLRILKIEKDAAGAVSGMWIGAIDPANPQYTAFHLIPQSAGGTVDPLAAWKKALVGKTFTPDVNWFVDWINFPPDFTGGWTSSSTFGDDFTTNSWVWDANVRAVAESASLAFSMDGDNIKLTLEQTKDGSPYIATGDVVINADKNILNINIPLVDYAGTAASWLPTTNTKSITGDTNDFYFVSHGGNNLSNIDTQGFWLGIVSGSTAAGDDKDEVLVYHFVLTP